MTISDTGDGPRSLSGLFEDRVGENRIGLPCKMIILVYALLCFGQGSYFQEITPPGNSNIISFGIGSTRLKRTFLSRKHIRVQQSQFRTFSRKRAGIITNLISINENSGYERFFTDNSVEYALSYPWLYTSGSTFFYTDANCELISYAIQKRYGKPMSESFVN